MITKEDFGIVAANVQSLVEMDLKSFAALADKTTNYAIEGFSFIEGDEFVILKFAEGISDMSNVPMTETRKARIAEQQGLEKGTAPDLTKVKIPYISISLTRQGVTEKRGITVDRLLNSDMPATNTGYTAEVAAKLDAIRKTNPFKLSGRTEDRLNALGNKRWKVIYSDNPSKNVQLQPAPAPKTPITPHIHVYQQAGA